MTIIKTGFIHLLCSFLILASCKQSKTTPIQEEKEIQPSAAAYPALGNQEIANLYAIAEKSDMIFYNLPISVNQDDAKSAKNSVLYISPAPVKINNNCKSIGRLSWLAEGVIVKEADIYIDSLCHYFIFMENNKPVAANEMSQLGVDFFTNIITQVQQRQK